MKKIIIAALVVASLIGNSVPAMAEGGSAGDASVKMTVDAILGRPLGLAATAVGTALFIVALPFAALGGNVKPVAQTLVVDPFKFTFTRPLGDFSAGEGMTAQ